jgi:ribosomal protein S8
MNNKIIKLLISLKNAAKIKQLTTKVELTKINFLVIKLLYSEGLIQSFSINRYSNGSYYFLINLRYSFDKSVLSTLRIVSKPSLSKYIKYNDVCRFSNKFFFAALSTDKQIKSLYDCKKLRLGGQFLFICS